MRRILIAIAVAVLVIAATGVLLAQEARPPADKPAQQLTAEQQAVLKQAQDLQKQVEINRLELRLAELKGAPQEELAKKATEGYELRGKLQALWMKNPEVARAAWSERGHRRGAGRGMGMGPGMGQGMGHRQRGGEGRGMGMQRGQGMGPGMGMGPGTCPAMGMGRGQGMGPGMGMGQNCPMGPGMGQGRQGRGMGQGMGRGHGGRGMGQGPGMMRGPETCPWAGGKAAPSETPAPEPAPAS